MVFVFKKDEERTRSKKVKKYSSILRVSQTAPVYLDVHEHLPSTHLPPFLHGGSHATMYKRNKKYRLN